jgi:hypothetical protein
MIVIVITNVEIVINKLPIRTASKVLEHGTTGGQKWSSTPNIAQYSILSRFYGVIIAGV